MRILQLIYSRNFAGSEQSVLTLSRALQAQGHEVLVAVKSGGTLGERYRSDGLEVIPLPLNAFFVSWRLAKFAREARIDVIHSHLTEATRIARRVSRLTKIPMVAHLRILRDDPAYREAGCPLIANSEHTAQFYREKAGVASERIRVVPNATPALHDPVADAPVEQLAETVRSELGVSPAARLIAFPGRIAPEKGHETMLRAMPAVLAQHPDTHVLVAGNLDLKPSYRRKLLKLRARLGLEGHVHFLGFQRNVLRFTRAAEAQLVLSKREPFGLVVIEAMAMCTPLIGADSGAIPSILEYGALGTLVPPEAPLAVAAALNCLLDQPAQFRAMAEAAKRRVWAQYSPEKLAERVVQVYEAAVQQDRPAKSVVVGGPVVSSSAS